MVHRDLPSAGDLPAARSRGKALDSYARQDRRGYAAVTNKPNLKPN